MCFTGGNLRPAINIRTRLIAVAVALVGALLVPAGAAQARTHGLKVGFTDWADFQFPSDPAQRQIAFEHARAAGTEIVRLPIAWSDIAPTSPPNNATAADPSWPGYDWSTADTAVRETVANGMTPLVMITNAPRWAEGPKRPADTNAVPEGTWRPNASAFQAFASALAKRFSGRSPDPANPGASLPRVRYWQGWNEPNLTTYLNPQWVRSRGRLVAESPTIYRGLLNAFYRGLKGVSSGNVVITGGTSPFGDRPGGNRIPPALFVRDLFCLSGRKALRRVRCKGSPVHFDILAHHPYPIGPPRRHAPNPDDVVIADWSRLTRPLNAALRARTVAPHKRKGLWATEVSWDSNPPDPQGIPAHLEATYMEGAFSTMWSEGVSAVIWYLMRDEAPVPSFAQTLQSGIYFRGQTVAEDTPKPSFTSFSFPFTAYIHKGRAQFWGLAPSSGPVTVQRQGSGGSWTTVARLRARSDRLFLGSKRLKAGTQVRAVQGSNTSLTWKVFSPGR